MKSVNKTFLIDCSVIRFVKWVCCVHHDPRVRVCGRRDRHIVSMSVIRKQRKKWKVQGGKRRR